jgi:hypothetical protein
MAISLSKGISKWSDSINGDRLVRGGDVGTPLVLRNVEDVGAFTVIPERWALGSGHGPVGAEELDMLSRTSNNRLCRRIEARQP